MNSCKIVHKPNVILDYCIWSNFCKSISLKNYSTSWRALELLKTVLIQCSHFHSYVAFFKSNLHHLNTNILLAQNELLSLIDEQKIAAKNQHVNFEVKLKIKTKLFAVNDSESIECGLCPFAENGCEWKISALVFQKLYISFCIFSQ